MQLSVYNQQSVERMENVMWCCQ